MGRSFFIYYKPELKMRFLPVNYSEQFCNLFKWQLVGKIPPVKIMRLSIKTLSQRWKTLNESWRFAIITFLMVRLFYALWSLAILMVQPLAVQNIELSNEPMLTIFNLQNSQPYTYLREINGQVLTFRAASASTVTDLQTGSTWDISTGIALQGQYQGSVLTPSKTVPSEIFPYHNTRPYPIRWLAIWQRFDANWYTSVADNGYGTIGGDDHFPPLFPVLIRILDPLFGSAFLAGLLISHLATLYAIKLSYDTFYEWGGNDPAKRTVLFLLIYPTSFFLFSVYTESLFLVTALLSLQYMKKGSWAWAGFWIFCALLTRLQGAALIIPMIYLMWREHSFLRKPASWFGLALPAIGGLFYLFLRSMQVTNGVVPLVESDWHARLVLPWQTYWYAIQTLASGSFTFIDFLNWAVVTLFMILLVAGWRKIPLEYNLYTAFSLLIMLIRIVETQPLISMSRYSLMLFPSFFILGLAGENPMLRRLIIYTFIPLNLYLSAQFFLWGWVA
jgi:dolichyl-phosphate-mannose-protein mannosyltransferase